MRCLCLCVLPLLAALGPSAGVDLAFPHGGAVEGGGEGRLRVVHSWKQLDFLFPDDATRRAMVDSGQFIQVNNLIIDVNVYGDGPSLVTFVTVPRVRPGVPATLATVARHHHHHRHQQQPLLRPFPDWNTNLAVFANECDDGITSVFRTYIDECGRLWVLDSGRIDAWDANATTVCDPKLLVYDLRHGHRLIGKYRVPRELLEETSLLVTIVVEVVGGCCSVGGGDAFAYIADTPVYRMIVFHLATGQFWPVTSDLFVSDPQHYQFTVQGVSFQFKEGLFGMALSPKLGCGQRRLYFHGIASVRQSWVDTAVLRDRALWRDVARRLAAPPAAAFHRLEGERPSQSVVSAMTGRGLLLFGLTGSDELACWDSRTPFGGDNIVRLVKDDEKLQFNTGMKLYKGKIYLVTNRIQNYVSNDVKTDEVNYYVLEGDVRSLTAGTACGGRGRGGVGAGGVEGLDVQLDFNMQLQTNNKSAVQP